MPKHAGSDIRVAAKEAAMRPLRRLMEQLEPIHANNNAKTAPTPSAGPAALAVAATTGPHRVIGKQGVLAASSTEASCSSSSRGVSSSKGGACVRDHAGRGGFLESPAAATAEAASGAAVGREGRGTCGSVGGNGMGGLDGTASQEMIGPITGEDVAGALRATKPSARLYEAEYKAFSETYGQIM